MKRLRYPNIVTARSFDTPDLQEIRDEQMFMILKQEHFQGTSYYVRVALCNNASWVCIK
jgi:hypothetical protein